MVPDTGGLRLRAGKSAVFSRCLATKCRCSTPPCRVRRRTVDLLAEAEPATDPSASPTSTRLTDIDGWSAEARLLYPQGSRLYQVPEQLQPASAFSAGGVCVALPCCSANPTCCCSMSQQTTFDLREGFENYLRNTPHGPSSSATTANC
jgi:hypothetical protein